MWTGSGSDIAVSAFQQTEHLTNLAIRAVRRTVGPWREWRTDLVRPPASSSHAGGWGPPPTAEFRRIRTLPSFHRREPYCQRPQAWRGAEPPGQPALAGGSVQGHCEPDAVPGRLERLRFHEPSGTGVADRQGLPLPGQDRQTPHSFPEPWQHASGSPDPCG